MGKHFVFGLVEVQIVGSVDVLVGNAFEFVLMHLGLGSHKLFADAHISRMRNTGGLQHNRGQRNHGYSCNWGSVGGGLVVGFGVLVGQLLV